MSIPNLDSYLDPDRWERPGDAPAAPEIELTVCKRCGESFDQREPMFWYGAWAEGSGWHCEPCWHAAVEADGLTPERVIR